MNLLDFLLERTHAAWRGVFPQQRTLERVVNLAFGLLCGVGKRTITRGIGFHGNEQKDWSADYKVFSRSPWNPRDLFEPIIEEAIRDHGLERIVVNIDDTRLWRTGKKVPMAQYHRDPLSPPFQTHLRWGHRFLQASLTLPLYQQDPSSGSRAIPVRFELAPVVKKPGKRATSKQQKEYKQQRKLTNLSRQTVEMIQGLRLQLDNSGHRDKTLSIVGDGSFCNRRLFEQTWPAQRVDLTVRCRKDIKLCFEDQGAGRLFYGKEKFTPYQVHQDEEQPWQETTVFHGGRPRSVRYKEVSQVLWQSGAKRQKLRMFVVAPVGYRTSKNGRTYYRQPAYLLTTDLESPASQVLQDYFDRWGIEVNHRDEKSILGVGQAQVWNPESVKKVPALLVAMYSWLQLGALHCYGPRRSGDYPPLPKWRRKASRPSCQDLVNLLRKQLVEQGPEFANAEAKADYEKMVESAAA